jgi:hypothetical protein
MHGPHRRVSIDEGVVRAKVGVHSFRPSGEVVPEYPDAFEPGYGSAASTTIECSTRIPAGVGRGQTGSDWHQGVRSGLFDIGELLR